MQAKQIRPPIPFPWEEFSSPGQTFHLHQCSRSGQRCSGSRRRSSGARVATLFQIAANSFARWIDPHSYPISFCGHAHHIDGVRAPQAGDRLSTVGPRLRAKRVIRYSPLTTSSPLGRGRPLSIRGEAFRPGLEKAQTWTREGCFPQAANLESKWRGTGCALVSTSEQKR